MGRPGLGCLRCCHEHDISTSLSRGRPPSRLFPTRACCCWCAGGWKPRGTPATTLFVKGLDPAVGEEALREGLTQVRADMGDGAGHVENRVGGASVKSSSWLACAVWPHRNACSWHASCPVVRYASVMARPS